MGCSLMIRGGCGAKPRPKLSSIGAVSFMLQMNLDAEQTKSSTSGFDAKLIAQGGIRDHE